MTSIAVEQATSALQLHSCPSCGRHAWRADGVEVDRSTLLEALRVRKEPAARSPRLTRKERTAPPAAPARPPAPVGPVSEDDRRSELQRLLSGFTVHGSSS